MEEVPTDGSDRPLNKILMKNVVVYLDPFDEFLKQRREQEEREKQTAERKRKAGVDEDRTTWTGKRIRNHGSIADADAKDDVGKYLQASKPVSHDIQDAELDTWQEPTKKKAKAGGFNFDNW
jgi:peptidyl-prolyl cis-trans isomerase-like 2